MEQYIDEFGNLQFREPSNNLPFKSMVDMAAENKNFMNQFNFPSADLNNVPVEISQLPIASVPNNFLNYRFQNARTPFTPFKEGIETLKSNVSSGIGKGFDLGKAAIGGIASLVTGIPGLGLLLNAFGPMTEEEKAMKDFYGSEFGLDDIGRVQSGIMAGYAPVSGFGGPGLSKSINKRIETITKTLKKKKSVTLEKRLKELQALRQKEEQARERDRADRARAANAGVYADLDRRTGGKGYGDAGGFSTARAGKEGAFGSFDGSRGRKDYSKGGIVNLL